MTIDPNRKKLVLTIENLLERLILADPVRLARVESLSRELNFERAVPYLQEMLLLCKRLHNRNFGILPSQYLNSVVNALTHIDSLVQAINSFSLKVPNPGDHCEDIIRQISEAYDGVAPDLIKALAYTAPQTESATLFESQAQSMLSSLSKQKDAALEKLQNIEQEAVNALEAVRKQAAEVGASQNASIFEERGKAFDNTAKLWLWATGVSGIIAVATVIIFIYFSFQHTPATPAEAIQQGISKALLITLSFYSIIWCARNYRSFKHNAILSFSRGDALKTFNAFREGTSEGSVKDAILLHAAQSAFGARNTGFDSNEETQQISPIVEIISKSIQGAGKP